MLRLVALLAFAFAVPAAAPAAPPDPLVGTWRYGDGTVQVVRHANGSFTGTVRSTVRFAACPHLRGEAMWRLWGGEGSYSGRQLSFGPRPGCGWRVPLAASIRVHRTVLELRVARREAIRPGACGALTDCFRLVRVGPPPAPTPAPVAEPAPAPRPTLVADVSFTGSATGSGLGSDYTSSSGAGRFEVAGRDVTGSLLLTHTYSARGELTVLRGVRVAAAAPGRLELVVTVVRSATRGCAAGSTGTVSLRDATDAVRVRVCGSDLGWTGAVRIGAP